MNIALELVIFFPWKIFLHLLPNKLSHTYTTVCIFIRLIFFSIWHDWSLKFIFNMNGNPDSFKRSMHQRWSKRPGGGGKVGHSCPKGGGRRKLNWTDQEKRCTVLQSKLTCFLAPIFMKKKESFVAFFLTQLLLKMGGKMKLFNFKKLEIIRS